MEPITLILIIVLFIIIGYLIYLNGRLNSIVKNMKKSEKSGPEQNIVSILQEIQDTAEKVLKKSEEFPDITEGLENKISSCIQKIGTNQNGSLSLEDKEIKDVAMAFLNNHGDGVVINFTNNRVSVKTIEKGQSHIKLSKEEEKAVDSALN